MRQKATLYDVFQFFMLFRCFFQKKKIGINHLYLNTEQQPGVTNVKMMDLKAADQSVIDAWEQVKS